MKNSVKTDDVIFNFFKQICDEKNDEKCVELGKNWISAMEMNLKNMESNLDETDKLKPGDLLMMDNHRLLHGRTEYNANEGNRFLQGCYIDYDSTEGKLKHLKRKFNI